MKFVFRTDASLQIGSGHVMRCLAMADELTMRGFECHFICRAHEGNLGNLVRRKGYTIDELPVALFADSNSIALGSRVYDSAQTGSFRLGASQAQDAEACAPLLAALCPDWVVVDHYGLDAQWEAGMRPYCRGLMVIDDLADRPHACDLLLDQTFGRNEADYRQLVHHDCRILCGSKYALLRPEFASLRPYSLERRAQPALREILISMGGVDKDNATGKVLEALHTCPLPASCRVTVVMGATAPWVDEVRRLARASPWPTRVVVGVRNIAQLMADSDLAIGAAGTSAWERCALGLPSIILVLAENQRRIAAALKEAGAAKLIHTSTVRGQRLTFAECMQTQSLSGMSAAAASITDGLGVTRVINTIVSEA